MIKSICEKIIMPVRRKTKMEIPILKKNRKNTVPNLLIVFVMVILALSLSSISSLMMFSLSSPLLESGLVDKGFSTRSVPRLSMSVVPYWSSSQGCFTCMENRLSRIKSTLSFPLASESGKVIFVPSDKLALLMSDEKSLIFAM